MLRKAEPNWPTPGRGAGLDKRMSRKGHMHLSASRKKNKGQNLVRWWRRQKELAAQRGTESTAGNEVGQVQETSAVESTSTSQAVPNKDLSIPTLVSSTDTIQESSTSAIQSCSSNTIQDSITNTIQGSNVNPILIEPDSSTAVKNSVTFKRNRDTRVAKIQVDFDSSPTSYYKGKIIYCPTKESKEVQTFPKENTRVGISIRGRRIIDFDFFFKALKKASNHNKFGCNLNDMIIENEKKTGIFSRFSLRCKKCNFHKVICSENIQKESANTHFVSGMLNIKCSLKDMKQLLATMRLPPLSQYHFTKECKKIKKKTAENSGKSLSNNTNSERTAQKGIPPSSEENNVLEQVDLGGLLIDDQLEIKHENVFEKENKTVVPDDKARRTSVDQDQLTCYPAIVKEEIDSESDDNESVDSTSNRIETLNGESSIEDEQADTVLPQQAKTKMCQNQITVKETQANLQNIPVIQSIPDNKLVNCMPTELKIPDKKCVTNFDNPCPKKAKIETHENILDTENLNNPTDTEGISTPTVPNKEQNFLEHRFQSNELVTTPATNIMGGNYVYIMPVQPMDNSSGNSSTTFIAPQMQPNVAAENYQGVNSAAFMPQTAPVVKSNAGDSDSGLLNLTSFVNNYNAPTNPFVNNLTTPSNNQLILIPAMMGPTYIPSSTTAAQQHPSLSNVTLNSGPISMPSTSTAIQQPPGLNIALNNSGSISMPSTATAVLQPPGLLNSTLNNVAAISMPLAPPAIPQPSNSADNRPPFPTDASRWVGRSNMNNNNPFCTLPGGAPKGVSDTVPPRQDSDKDQCKQQQFHCDDCDVSFKKYKSLEDHKKSYCIKRLKLQPSSTVTDPTMMNNQSKSSQMNPANQATQLLSAMAIKRSLLEASVKIALEAQYVINLNKSAQDLTRRSFKELDDALKKEKALRPDASFEEQQIASKVRAQALINAKAAYMQEKYSADAVEQALYQQKKAIEASLTATGHEQTILISTMRSLRESESNFSSVPQTLYNNLSQTKNFNQEKIIDSAVIQTTDQHVAKCVSSKSVLGLKSTLTPSGFCIGQRNEIDVTSSYVTTDQQQITDCISSKSVPGQKTPFCTRHRNEIDATASYVDILKNASSFYVPSEKLSAVNLEENKVVTPKPPEEPLQLKKINKLTSYSNSNIPIFNYDQTVKNKEVTYNKLPYDSFHEKKIKSSTLCLNSDSLSLQDYQKRQSSDYSYFPNGLCLKVGTQDKATSDLISTLQLKRNSLSHESSQPQESEDFSMEFSPEKSHANICQSEEMDFSDSK